jgi:hypothetical protein
MEQPNRPDGMRMNKTALARPLAWSLDALSLVLTLAGLAAAWHAGEKWLDTHLLFGLVTAIAYALVGAPWSPRGSLATRSAGFLVRRACSPG